MRPTLVILSPALLSLFICLGSLTACKRDAASVNILLITVDTLRPDALGFVDATRDTPTIDALARAGQAFSGAVSPVPLTLPSHTSMLSGQLPRRHGVHDNGQNVPADIPLLQETLKQNGYRTGAFVSGFPLQAMYGLDRGFDHYDDALPDGEQGWVERRAKDTVAAVSGWLNQADEATPWFGWVHFYDPHSPYEPPREFWQPGPRGSYDGEVVYTDYWIGKLLETARQVSVDRPLLVVLTADHGEALGEHDEVTHGYFIYDSTMRVPLIFQWQGRFSAGLHDDAVQLIDIAPTILDLLELPPYPEADGRSLRVGLEGGVMPVHPALMETWLPWTYYGWAPLNAWRDGDWKYIDAPNPELYRTSTDRHEAENLATHEMGVADRMALTLDVAMQASARVAASNIDDAAIQRLRSLGYIGVGSPVETPPDNLADPKLQIAARQQLEEAENLLRAQRYADAQAILSKVLAEDPDNRFAALRSGIALLRTGNAEDAVEVLRRAVRVEPRRAEARFALGDALMRTKDFVGAAEEWAALAELQPRRAETWFNLASALEQAGETERASSARIEYENLRAKELPH